MYQYELHCHSGEVSHCSHVAGVRMVEEFKKAGYDGMVLTDHLSPANFRDWKTRSWRKTVDSFLSGYRNISKFSDETFAVMLGMELRFTEDYNDYLVYGFDEDFLYKNEGLLTWGVKKFSAAARENGFLLIQAHPFRNRITIRSPDFLDGVEVHNGNPRHDSRNDIAKLWAEKYKLIQTSGSDYHELVDVQRGGIRTREKISEIHQLTRVLRAGAYELLTGREEGGQVLF